MAKINDLAALDRALATVQAALSGGAITLAGPSGAASGLEAGKRDAIYMSTLITGLIATIQQDGAQTDT